MTVPKISIVTVVYNGEDHIEETIKSVINQSFKDYEHIIIDGKSTDRTLEIINHYKDHFAYFVSEPDKGIYDAMNKGIEVAKGEWIYFLNVGDTFFKDTTLEELFNQDLEGEIIYGSNEADYGYFKRINKPKHISEINLGMIFSHQAVIVPTELMKEHPFDLKYKMCADFNFIYRIYWEGRMFQKIDLVFASLLADGASEVNIIQTHKERKHIVLGYEHGKPIAKQLKRKYNRITFRLRLIKFAKWILPKKMVQKLTQKKYS